MPNFVEIIFNGRNGWRSNCVTVPNFIKVTQTAAVIWWFFEMAAAAILDKMEASAILDFWNFNFLRSEWSRRLGCVAVPNGRNRSNLGWYVTIFLLYKMAAAILDFKNCKLLTVGMVKEIELHHYAKFCRNHSYQSPDMAIFEFLRWWPLPFWIFQIVNF